MQNGVAQCVSAGAGLYNFGGWFKGTTTKLDCTVQLWTAPDCMGTPLDVTTLPDTALNPLAWTEVTTSVPIGNDAKSAFVVCYAWGLLVDKMYLSPAPLRF